MEMNAFIVIYNMGLRGKYRVQKQPQNNNFGDSGFGWYSE